MDKVWDNTQEWNDYKQGIDYNTKIDLYNKTELNWRMYNGNQWYGAVMNGLSKWTFNICKSAINYFVSFICSQKVKLQYSADNVPDDPTDPNDAKAKEFVTLLSGMADMKWEKDKMDAKLRELMLDGANSGDYCVHVYWDKNKKTGQLEQGDFFTEIVDAINVMFGNPNNKLVEPQPYILVVGREMVSKLKEEAKANGISDNLIMSITSDTDTSYQAGTNGKIELQNNLSDTGGKCNYVIKYWKKNGEVFCNKSTRYCPIWKDRPLGINRYPIAWGNWETLKNSYHGLPVIEGIIDNQLSINQMFAMVSYWMKMAAYGKVIYDKTRISAWSNTLGTAIAANGDVQGIVQQLDAGNFNSAVLTVIDMAIKYTKDFVGANDALMGQVNPEQASGTAIISTAKQASMPLGSISANRDQFVEDIGLIWAEFFMKKYKSRKVSIKQDDKVVNAQYESAGMEELLLNCKVDVGPSTYWSEITGIQALDKLLEQGVINKLQYFERIQKMNIIPDTQGLIEDAQAEMQMQEQMAQQQDMQMQQEQQMQGQQQEQQMMAQQEQEQQEQQEQEAKFEQMAQFVESLPPDVQKKIQSLPVEQQEPMIMQMMKQSVQQSMKPQ